MRLSKIEGEYESEDEYEDDEDENDEDENDGYENQNDAED